MAKRKDLQRIRKAVMPYNRTDKKGCSNWSLHHEGNCDRCSHYRQVNRFGLCFDCFSLLSSASAGDDWIFMELDKDWDDGLWNEAMNYHGFI